MNTFFLVLRIVSILNGIAAAIFGSWMAFNGDTYGSVFCLAMGAISIIIYLLAKKWEEKYFFAP
jgi:hypothetical protein